MLLTARRGRSNLISLDQDDKQHLTEAGTFRYYEAPEEGVPIEGAPDAIVAVPGSFSRRAAFSNRDYDWFVHAGRGVPCALDGAGGARRRRVVR